MRGVSALSNARLKPEKAVTPLCFPLFRDVTSFRGSNEEGTFDPDITI